LRRDRIRLALTQEEVAVASIDLFRGREQLTPGAGNREHLRSPVPV
jgi:hypothetical protein